MTDPDKLAQVEAACGELAHQGKTVNFVDVAEAVGLSRTTLYRNPDYRAVIEQHRAHAADQALTITGIAVQLDQLRLGLEAVADRVRAHEETLRRLDRKQTRRTG